MIDAVSLNYKALSKIYRYFALNIFKSKILNVRKNINNKQKNILTNFKI